MDGAFKISEAGGLAIHSVTLIARLGRDEPVKLARLAKLLKASETHLGKVLNRLAQARIVTSKRGPAGGFTLGPRAAELTLLDIYELIDGPIGESDCLLGYLACPLGGCVLGDAVAKINAHAREVLGAQLIIDLAATGPGSSPNEPR